MHIVKTNLLLLIIILTTTSCSMMIDREKRQYREFHSSINYTQKMMKINLRYVFSKEHGRFQGESYSLYLNNEFLMNADKHRTFHLTDKKLRWKLYEHYKKNKNICFEIRLPARAFDFSIKCFTNTELEAKFASDIKISELEKAIATRKRNLSNETVVKNINFNSKNQVCEAPYIKPISNLCGKPQEELDRLYVDCFRPLGAKACSYAAKQSINSSNLTRAEKRRRGIAATYLCKKGVGGDISVADIADEIGDELTDSDSMIVSGIGYLFEGAAAIQNTATVTSCLARFDMHCDVEENNRKASNYQQCKNNLVDFNKSKSEISKLTRQLNQERQNRSRIVNKRDEVKSRNFPIDYIFR